MKKSLVFLSLLLLLHSCFSLEVFSSINATAVNQYGEPLPDIMFYLSCDSNGLSHSTKLKPYYTYPAPGIDYHAGGECYGCENESSATITAVFFDQKQTQVISDWKGFSCLNWGRHDGITCCHEFWPPVLPPRVKPLKFTFNSSKLSLVLNVDGLPAQRVVADATWRFFNKTYSRRCQSDSDGFCKFSDLPNNEPIYLQVLFGDRNPFFALVTPGTQKLNISYKKGSSYFVFFNATTYAKNWSVESYSLSKSLLKNPNINDSCLLGFISPETNVSLACYDANGSISKDQRRNINANQSSPPLMFYSQLYASFGDKVLVRFYEDDTLKFSAQFFMNESKSVCLQDGKPCKIGCQNDSDCEDGEYCTLTSPRKCCPLGTYSNGTACVSHKEKFQVFFVPVNQAPTNSAFTRAVRAQAEYMGGEVGLPMTSFIIVNETLNISSCPLHDSLLLKSVEDHFKRWYAAATGYNMKAEADYDQYRVIGIDNENVCKEDSCAFTSMIFNHAIYLTGRDCSYSYHVSAHELGHTFSLCDDYNPNQWDKQNILQNIISDRSCPNDKPNASNSKCSNCGWGEACCFGVRLGDRAFSTMGSSNLYDDGSETGTQGAIIRQFSSPSKNRIVTCIMGAYAK